MEYNETPTTQGIDMFAKLAEANRKHFEAHPLRHVVVYHVAIAVACHVVERAIVKAIDA